MAKVSDESSAVKMMRPGWELASALLDGTDAMRAAGEAYLPKWPNEEKKSYEARLKTAVLFPAFKRTVQTLAAKPFSKPLTYGEDVPPKVLELCQNIDLQGRNLHVFSAEVMRTAMGPGLAGILVDFPPAEGVVTLADEQKAGLRPYFVHIRPEQLLGWRATMDGGVWAFTMLRFKELVTEDDGDFGEVEVEQIRVLEPTQWRTYRKDKNKPEEWVEHSSGTNTLRKVPFVPVYGERVGFMVSKPPLKELAHLNIKHWQSQSDQDTILHVARVPILAVVGVDDDKFSLTVGASTAVKLPTGGELMYVEHTGAAIEAGKTSLDDLKEEMRQAGAELLVLKPVTTATQVHSENAVGMCVLQEITLGLQDALNAALQLMADWLKEPTGGGVTLFTDFGAATLSEATAQLIKDMAAAGLLSKETAFKEQQRRGVISADVDWEEEQGRIEAEGPALGDLSDIGQRAPAV